MQIEQFKNSEICPSCNGSGVMDEENFDFMQCNECLGCGLIFYEEDDEDDDEEI